MFSTSRILYSCSWVLVPCWTHTLFSIQLLHDWLGISLVSCVSVVSFYGMLVCFTVRSGILLGSIRSLATCGLIVPKTLIRNSASITPATAMSSNRMSSSNWASTISCPWCGFTVFDTLSYQSAFNGSQMALSAFDRMLFCFCLHWVECVLVLVSAPIDGAPDPIDPQRITDMDVGEMICLLFVYSLLCLSAQTSHSHEWKLKPFDDYWTRSNNAMATSSFSLIDV